nr:hypothetical protein [Allomuricauda sp.]
MTILLQKILLLVFFLSSLLCSAQMDCSLGVGGRDDETIIQVFQLNEDQKEKMKNWSAELNVRNTLLKDKAKRLLKQHEESSPEALIQMSMEYKTILDSMRANVLMIDKRLLSVFNKRQYDLYVELCSSISMHPIFVRRSDNEK